MAQPEKRENSVLFSLRELRQIEEKRVEEEDAAARSAEEARVRAKMEEERRKREEEEAKVRAVEDAERAVRDAQERKVREEQLRLQESEARARVEAQAQLDAQRLAHEMELRRHEISKKRPVGLMVAAGVLVLAIVGLGVFLYQKNKESNEKDDQIAAQNKANDELQKQVNDLNTKLSDLNSQADDIKNQIAAAQNTFNNAKGAEAQREAQEKIDALKRHQQEVADSIAATQRAAAAAAEKKRKAQVHLDEKCLNGPLGC
jgi:cell division protein FtsL